jgi:hypothetical protein
LKLKLWQQTDNGGSFSATEPPSPIFYHCFSSSFHCICEQITLLLRLLSHLKPSQTLT